MPIWLRSTGVVHFLGKEEVMGPNPIGASRLNRLNGLLLISDG